MDNKTGSQNGRIQINKKIKQLDNRTIQGDIINIPANGIEQDTVHKVTHNEPFWGKNPDGVLEQFIVVDNKIYKASSNYTEI